jgi:hypothetical protein
VFSVDAGAGGDRVLLGARPVQTGNGEQHGPRRADQGLARAGERLGEHLHGRQVGGRRAHVVAGTHGVLLEGEMDDPVRGGSGFPETVEVVQVAPVHAGAEGCQRGGRHLGSGQADDLVSGLKQFGDDGRADMAGWRR